MYSEPQESGEFLCMHNSGIQSTPPHDVVRPLGTYENYIPSLLWYVCSIREQVGVVRSDPRLKIKQLVAITRREVLRTLCPDSH